MTGAEVEGGNTVGAAIAGRMGVTGVTGAVEVNAATLMLTTLEALSRPPAPVLAGGTGAGVVERATFIVARLEGVRLAPAPVLPRSLLSIDSDAAPAYPAP